MLLESLIIQKINKCFIIVLTQVLNPIEFCAGVVVENEYVECTSAAIQALILFKKMYPGHRKKEIENFITKAIGFLEGKQMPDGSWYNFLLF